MYRTKDNTYVQNIFGGHCNTVKSSSTISTNLQTYIFVMKKQVFLIASQPASSINSEATRWYEADSNTNGVHLKP